MKMLPIYIGFDARETAAYHVLAHSIQARASRPVAIVPLDLRHLEGIYERPMEGQTTAFTYSRFLVPWLCHYEGYAIFVDCDMLCLDDIYKLGRYALQQPEAAVCVAHHDYVPKPGPKFLGQPQMAYPRKNWSSVMVFNNANCRMLTPDYVNHATGSMLHRFDWCRDDQIGVLPLEWNWLVEEYPANARARLLHYTRGGPWFEPYADCDHSKEWWQEYDRMKAIG